MLHGSLRESVETALALRHLDGVADSGRVNLSQKSE
jgi:hypothetical protein